MSNEILYCSRCQTRLLGQQFVEGTAFRVRDQASCENCLGEIIAPLSLEEQQEILLQVKTLKDSQLLEELPQEPVNQEEFFELDTPEAATDDFFELDTPEKRAARSRRPAVPVTTKAAAIEESQNRAVAIFLFCLVGIAALGSFLYYSGTPDYVPVPPPPPPPAYNPSVRSYGDRSTVADPRADEAKALMEKARDFAKSNPMDLAGQQEAFKKALDVAVGTPYGPDAKREYDQLGQKQKDLLAREFEPLDKETAAALEKEDFKAAMDRLEQAKPKYSVGEWRGGIDLRMRNLRNSIWKALFPLRDKAVEAKQNKKEADVKVIVDRVAKWGLPEFLRELDNALGGSGTIATTTTTPDLKEASPELKAYDGRWRQAMELASRRDYDAAAVELAKAGGDLKEADSKTAFAADQDILKRIQGVHRDALQAVSLWKRNEKISLEYLDENLGTARAEDPFLRADNDRIEMVRNGAPWAIEVSELTVKSLVHLLRKSKGDLSAAETLSAALLCLVEGELDAARQTYTGPTDQIPYKYWSLASKIAESRSPSGETGKRELAARRMYFIAERDYSDMKTRAMSIQSYRDLLNQYGDTSIVKRRRAQINARREGTKDYVFLPIDMDAAGTFRPGRHPKFAECWASSADTDPSHAAGNYVGAKFYGFQDVAYQCWAYIGGCCAEVLGATYQATDLTFPNPKGGEVLKIEPGSNNSMSVRHQVSFLKPVHSAHGGAKEAKIWEWAELKLPKYSLAGVKEVRIVTDQKAFSVAFIVVSASRGGPPSEAEMKSWIKKPDVVIAPPVDESPTAVVAAVVEARDPSLIGHWKLDEFGATALDASGRDNGGVLVNEPSRVPGKMSGAIAFDGKERYVNLPNSDVLDKAQENTYTVACWFKPNSKPGSPNDAAYAIIAKSGAHEGLTYNADQKFVMDHVLANGSLVSAASTTAFAPGNYYHVAGVVSRSEGSVRIYVNGKQEGAGSFAPGGTAKDFKNETWKIGIAAPGTAAQRLAADGIVDDVRLYNRALQAADLKTIAGISGGVAPSVVITSPLPGEKFDLNATIPLSVTVTPGDRIAKLDFYAGSTRLASKTSPPFTYTWDKVAGGNYTLTARATDRSGTVYTSPPLTIRVGSPSLYRALNLNGAGVRVDGVDFEGKTAKKISCNGSPVEIKSDLIPAPDPGLASLLKTAMMHPKGTSVSLIEIPNGPYQVFLYVCSEGTPQTYDLQIAGKIVQSKVQSGPPGTWQKLGPWTADASGGLLEVAAKGGEANFCALEVWRVAK